MFWKIITWFFMVLGLIVMGGGGIWAFLDPRYNYILCFLLPGYFFFIVGVSFALRKYFDLPNILTISRMLAVPLILIMLLPGIYNRQTALLACAIFCLASVTDILDGFLARRMAVVSNMGKFLDPLADKLVYLTILVALIPRHIVPMWLVLIVLIRELFITGLRTVAAGEGMIIAASRWGKLKTIFALTGMAALLVHHTYLVDFFLFKLPVSFHVLGLVLTYISLFFCITSALEYTYRVVKQLAANKKAASQSETIEAANGAG